MIRINLMNQLSLEGVAAPSAQTPARSKTKPYLYGILGVVVIAAGVVLAFPDYLDQLLGGNSETTTTATTEPAKATDSPKLVAVEKIDEVNLDSAASVEQALASGKITTQAAFAGVTAAQMNGQSLAMLQLLKQYTPTSVRFAKVAFQAPNFLAAQGMIETSKDFEIWKKSLAAKSVEVTSDSLRTAQGSSNAKIFGIAARLERPALEQDLVTVSATQLTEESQKFSKQLQSVLGTQELPKPSGVTQIGSVELHYFDQSISAVDFDKLLRLVESVKTLKGAVGIAQINLDANQSEGVDATIRYAVFVGK